MRSKTIEVMKGLAITGIVLLHAIFIDIGGNNSLSVVLRLTAVKVLLFLSGYVAYGKITRDGWLTEKIIRRIPILVIFTGVYWIFGTYIAGIDGNAKLSVDIGTFYAWSLGIGFSGLVIWYIWVLILCYVLIWLFEKHVTLKIPYLLKFSVLAFAIIWLPIDFGGFNFVRWYGLFMFLGYAVRYIVENHKTFTKYAEKLTYLSFIIFPITLMSAWQVVGKDGEWVSCGYVNILNALKAGEGKYVSGYLAVTLSGIPLIYCVSKYLTRIPNPFVFIGSSTIGILLFHKIFLEMKLIDNYLLAALAAETIALVIYQGLKRVRILDYLLFGGTDIPVRIAKGGWHGQKEKERQEKGVQKVLAQTEKGYRRDA